MSVDNVDNAIPFLDRETPSKLPSPVDFLTDNLKSVSCKQSPGELRRQLRQRFGGVIRQTNQVVPLSGCATGWARLDQQLLWKGLPFGELTQCVGSLGMGGTLLWLKTALGVLRSGRWAAWISTNDICLHPAWLEQQKIGLQHLLMIKVPHSSEIQRQVLHEVLSAQLFDLVGFAGSIRSFSPSHMQQIKVFCRSAKVALCFVHTQHQRVLADFALSFLFTRDSLVIERALHRPTPIFLPRKELYENFMHQLAAPRAALGGRKFFGLQPASSVS